MLPNCVANTTYLRPPFKTGKASSCREAENLKCVIGEITVAHDVLKRAHMNICVVNYTQSAFLYASCSSLDALMQGSCLLISNVSCCKGYLFRHCSWRFRAGAWRQDDLLFRQPTLQSVSPLLERLFFQPFHGGRIDDLI